MMMKTERNKRTQRTRGVGTAPRRTLLKGLLRGLLPVLLTALLTGGALVAQAAESIKFATLAPDGSTWMNNFEAMAKEIRSKTDGDVRFRFYSNGIQGDELDVIRKMRAGLLHAGAMTATGLGEIQPEVLSFQLPRMFRSYAELDHVLDYLREDLDAAFLEAGYVLLGMGDIGFYYIQ